MYCTLLLFYTQYFYCCMHRVSLYRPLRTDQTLSSTTVEIVQWGFQACVGGQPTGHSEGKRVAKGRRVAEKHSTANRHGQYRVAKGSMADRQDVDYSTDCRVARPRCALDRG